MVSSCDLLVFTDLDGTLIDHTTYDYAPARPALSALKRVSAGLVLASSKTSSEISALRQELGVQDWPAIVENGSGVLPPLVTHPPEAAEYDRVRAALDRVPRSLRRLFRGFGDVSVDQLTKMTGLSTDGAARAKERGFSEPGKWSGTPSEKDAFLAALAEQGVSAQQGGRFLTLSLGANKVDQMRKIMETYSPRRTIALGDAPNDIAMLENADLGIIVANYARAPLPHLSGEDTGRIIRTAQAGPTGWNAAILDEIDRIERK